MSNEIIKRPSDLAELSIDFLSLSKDQRAVVEKCICRYTPQGSGKTDEIQQYIYLFLEAMRSLFGQSDWQTAENVLKDKALATWCLKSIVKISGDNVVNKGSDKLLETLISFNKLEIEIPSYIKTPIRLFGNLDLLDNHTQQICESAKARLQTAAEKQAKIVCSALLVSVQGIGNRLLNRTSQ